MYTKDVQGGQLVLPVLCPPNPVPRSPFQLATAGNTSEGASVTRACANSSTCVPNVTHPTHPAHVVKKSAVPTPVNPEQLLQDLIGYDQAEVNFLVDGFINGFKINYFGTLSLLSTHNHPSALDHKDVVEQKLSKELSLGRIAGPFISPPFTHYQSSPLGVVAKKEPNAFRLIHDLSYPQGNSINECIPKDFTAVSYETLDHVITLLNQFGRGALVGKTDIEDAFRIIPIHPSCYHLFGFTWNSNFFYDRCLPMGCSESCRIFERLTCALQWVLKTRGVMAVSHILDDFIFIGPPNSSRCLHDLNLFMALNTFMIHFEKLGEKPESETATVDSEIPFDTRKIMQSINEHINRPFTQDEVVTLIKKLKNKKACGIDNVINEYLKNSPTELIVLIVKMFNLVLLSGIVTTDWCIGIIKPIYKKMGSIDDPDNYRGITLLSCIGKLFTASINTRLTTYLDEASIIGEEQAGFREGYSTLDHIFALHSLVKFYLTHPKRLYCAFIDYKKAFDLVDRSSLWSKLIACGINGNVLKVIYNMYENAKSCVKQGQALSDFFSCEVGVRQGENLSPL